MRPWNHCCFQVRKSLLVLLLCLLLVLKGFPLLSPDASRALPEFPDIDLQGKALPEGVELEHIKSFQLLYREHCEVNQGSTSFVNCKSLWIKNVC